MQLLEMALSRHECWKLVCAYASKGEEREERCTWCWQIFKLSNVYIMMILCGWGQFWSMRLWKKPAWASELWISRSGRRIKVKEEITFMVQPILNYYYLHWNNVTISVLVLLENFLTLKRLHLSDSLAHSNNYKIYLNNVNNKTIDKMSHSH